MTVRRIVIGLIITAVVCLFPVVVQAQTIAVIWGKIQYGRMSQLYQKEHFA